jgi:hypothetical protein
MSGSAWRVCLRYIPYHISAAIKRHVDQLELLICSAAHTNRDHVLLFSHDTKLSQSLHIR